MDAAKGVVMALLSNSGERFHNLLGGTRVAVEKATRAVELAKLRRKASTWARPVHAAFILDGNRRYAVNAKLATCRMGHEMGMQRFYDLVELCHQYGIQHLSVYSFSIENFKRSQKELTAIFDILRVGFDDMAAPDSVVNRLGCRVRVIGDRSMVPAEVQAAIERAERATEHHTAMTVFFTVAYDGRDDIVQAAKKCVAEAVREAVQSTSSPSEDAIASAVTSAITMEAMTRHMYLRAHEAEVPPVDFVVRVGGGKRLSSFLMWDVTHAELHFDPVLWPAFSELEFLRALREFDRREASSQAMKLHYWSKAEPVADGQPATLALAR